MSLTKIDASQISGNIGGGINYISNNIAENDTSGWVTYNDGSAIPVDGTGGSPVITWTRTTSSPLRGGASFLFTKDAANRIGQGVSYDFTIDSTDKAKPIYVSFDYLPSGFTDDWLSVWIYDVTNAALIQPAPYLIKNVVNTESFAAVFQSSSNSTSYRLIINNTTTSASAYTVKFDNFKAGPSYAVMGSPVTDWQSYTPTTQGLGTLGGGSNAYWRRNGDSIDIMARLLTGTVTAVEARVYLPSGLSVDTSKLAGGRTVIAPLARETATAGNIVAVQANSGASNYLTFGTWTNAGSPFVVSTGTGLFGNSEQISFLITIPVLGWSSSVLMSDNADTRVVALNRLKTGSQSINQSVNSYLDFPSAQVDTHGAWVAGTGYVSGAGTWTVSPKFICPVFGVYEVEASVLCTPAAAWTVNNAAALSIHKNGSSIIAGSAAYAWAATTSPVPLIVHGNIQCNAGDTLQISGVANMDPSWSAETGALRINRLSGPSQIAATETVACRVYASSATSVSDNTITKVAYNSKSFDSHGSFNTSTNTFTAPVGGVYLVIGHIEWAVGSFASGGTGQIYLYKNSGQTSLLNNNDQPGVTSATKAFTQEGSDMVRLIAGDTLDIRAYQVNNGGTRNTNSGEYRVYASFVRIAN
jgi:hypothetical protein